MNAREQDHNESKPVKESFREGLKKSTAHDRVMRWCGVASAIVLIAYTTVTWWQYREAHANNNRASELAKQQADAAKVGSRPWIKPPMDINVLEPIGIQSVFGRPNLYIHIGYTLKNIGHSPALNVRVKVFPKLLEGADENSDSICSNIENTAAGGATMSENEQFTLDNKLDPYLPLAATDTHIRKVLLSGCIVYQDSEHHPYSNKVRYESADVPSLMLVPIANRKPISYPLLKTFHLIEESD